MYIKVRHYHYMKTIKTRVFCCVLFMCAPGKMMTLYYYKRQRNSFSNRVPWRHDENPKKIITIK